MNHMTSSGFISIKFLNEMQIKVNVLSPQHDRVQLFQP